MPIESDWRVVVELPLRSFSGERVGILDRDHKRARYMLRQPTMTTDESTEIGAHVDRTIAHLARALRVWRADMFKSLGLMQLDCQ